MNLKGRPITSYEDVQHLRIAVKKLREALDLAYRAHAPRAAKAIAKAIKSTDGARRYAETQFYARFHDDRAGVRGLPKALLRRREIENDID